jgi:hypothetical protein
VFLKATSLTVDAAGVVNIAGRDARIEEGLDRAQPGLGRIPTWSRSTSTTAPISFPAGGAPVAYNGGGNLPQPNSCAFQDGYFFFTIADGRVFASGLNALTQNALTFITVQAKADVTLLRGIAFSGLVLLFTTGHFEAWQDAANPAPAFPYARLSIGETAWCNRRDRGL